MKHFKNYCPLLLLIVMVCSLISVSCTSRSGKRVPKAQLSKRVVRAVNGSDWSITYCVLDSTEQNIYRAGDWVKMSPVTHKVTPIFDSSFILVKLLSEE